MQSLTPRQTAVVTAVRDLSARQGYPPTRAELAKELRITQQGVAGHLHAIERKGAIRCEPGTARGLVIPDS
jgi:repressor LexA